MHARFCEFDPLAPDSHDRAHTWDVGVVMRSELRCMEGQKSEQETSIVRILLVDDYLPWRRCISSMLERQPQLKWPRPRHDQDGQLQHLQGHANDPAQEHLPQVHDDELQVQELPPDLRQEAG